MTGSPLEFRHVDVFADAPLAGNGLIVFFDTEALTTGRMAELTVEFRQFESIFLTDIRLDQRTATARIFTAEEELTFAGHPVLGAAAALHERAGLGDDPAIWTLIIAGRSLTVVVSRQGTGWQAQMAQGKAEFGPPLSDIDLAMVVAALGLDLPDLAPGSPACVVSTGLAYLILPVTASALARAAICGADFEVKLTGLGAKFAYLFDPNEREGRTWDNLGAVEDVATGSAAGPAAAWMVAGGMEQPDALFEIHQGRFVGRPSTINVSVATDGAVSVGGRVVPVARGVLDPDAA